MKTYGTALVGGEFVDGEPFSLANIEALRELARPYAGPLGVDFGRCVGVRVLERGIEFTSVASAGQPAHVTEHGERFQVRRFGEGRRA